MHDKYRDDFDNLLHTESLMLVTINVYKVPRVIKFFGPGRCGANTDCILLE